jgi:hypothetical protein
MFDLDIVTIATPQPSHQEMLKDHVRIPVIVGSDSGIIVGSHSGSSWAVRRGLMLAAECLQLGGSGRQDFFAFAHGFAFEFEPMGSAQEAIQQGVSHRGVIT